MSIRRWSPMQDLISFRDSINRLYDDVFSRHFAGMGEWRPSVDVVDKGGEYVVRADLPGYNPENLEITVHDNSVFLRGEVNEERETNEDNYHIHERSFGSFSRTIPLGIPVKSDQAKATFKNGVLELTLPKVEAPKGKTVKIERE